MLKLHSFVITSLYMKAHCLFAIICNVTPLEVKYFEKTLKGNYHCLNDNVFELFKEDLAEKLSAPPKEVKKGRHTYYIFE